MVVNSPAELRDAIVASDWPEHGDGTIREILGRIADLAHKLDFPLYFRDLDLDRGIDGDRAYILAVALARALEADLDLDEAPVDGMDLAQTRAHALTGDLDSAHDSGRVVGSARLLADAATSLHGRARSESRAELFGLYEWVASIIVGLLEFHRQIDERPLRGSSIAEPLPEVALTVGERVAFERLWGLRTYARSVPPIEDDEPGSWQDLELSSARILLEAGYVSVQRQKELPLVRGSVNVDVHAIDPTSPPSTLIVECKHWATPVTKAVVHAFRTVTADSGANTGIIVSRSGFQPGAAEAAESTNVTLVDWQGFQSLFAHRWFVRHMVPAGRAAADQLIEYTEPINSRIQRKAVQLRPAEQARFLELRRLHTDLARGLMIIWYSDLIAGEYEMPPLPLRTSLAQVSPNLPDAVLDATALRPLLSALRSSYESATAEFDEVFGERA